VPNQKSRYFSVALEALESIREEITPRVGIFSEPAPEAIAQRVFESGQALHL
jgi:hypothetical protein